MSGTAGADSVILACPKYKHIFPESRDISFTLTEKKADLWIDMERYLRQGSHDIQPGEIVNGKIPGAYQGDLLITQAVNTGSLYDSKSGWWYTPNQLATAGFIATFKYKVVIFSQQSAEATVTIRYP